MKLINTILESILTSDIKNTIIMATSDVIISIHPQPTLLIPTAKQILVQPILVDVSWLNIPWTCKQKHNEAN